MDEHDFLLLLLTPNLGAYARMIDMLWENRLFEEYSLDLHCEDPEIKDFLQQKFAWAGGGSVPPLEDLIPALAEKFPPPFRHGEIFQEKITLQRLGTGQLSKLLERDALEREKNRIEISMTMKSPETTGIPKETYFKYLEEQYKPMLLDLVAHEDFFPDDFETTSNLLNGETDIIRKEERTFSLIMPCRDVTNSVWLLNQAYRNHITYDVAQLGGDELCAMAVEMGESPYLHLFCFAFGDTCFLCPGLNCSLIPRSES